MIDDWLVVGFNPSEKYEFINWDDDIPNIWKKMFQTTNQPFTFGMKSVKITYEIYKIMMQPRSLQNNTQLQY